LAAANVSTGGGCTIGVGVDCVTAGVTVTTSVAGVENTTGVLFCSGADVPAEFVVPTPTTVNSNSITNTGHDIKFFFMFNSSFLEVLY
jgi:hypothetical protein